MANPIVINANNYPPGIDISNAISSVALQLYTHDMSQPDISYEPLVIRTAEYSPVGQPNVIAWTTTNDVYMAYLDEHHGGQLTGISPFVGLSIKSEQSKIDYFYFTGFDATGDSFVILLFDKHDNYIGKIDNFDGIISNPGDSCRMSPAGPPCYSYCFGTYLEGRDVYHIKIGALSSAGSINSFTLVLG